VHLPNENVDKIKNEIDQISSRIQTERQQQEFSVLSLRDEKGAFEEQMRLKYLEQQSQLQAIQKEITDLENFNQ
jgi:hypothetical protein